MGSIPLRALKLFAVLETVSLGHSRFAALHDSKASNRRIGRLKEAPLCSRFISYVQSKFSFALFQHGVVRISILVIFSLKFFLKRVDGTEERNGNFYMNAKHAGFGRYFAKTNKIADSRLGQSPGIHSPGGKRRRGYVILATAVSIFALFGMIGLAVDLGRLYIFKSEAQAFADAAAITAATKLNGKSSGITAAQNSVLNSLNYFNFNTQIMPANVTTIEFSKATAGPWELPPINNASGYGFIRVTVRPALNLSFMQVVNAPTTASVGGQAIGAQIKQTFPQGGYMPFTPFALSAADPLNFGMSIGQEYAFLWPGNAQKQNTCAGNQVSWPLYNFSDTSVAGSNRGYFELQSASSIQQAIQGTRQTLPLNVGDIINLTNGQKQSEQSALTARALLDSDLTNYSPNGSGVAPAYYGNNMRLVVMPVNGGPSSTPNNMVLGFAAFLLPISYPNGGNKTWCAIYMGSRIDGGGTSAYPGGGSYVVRLVQ